MNRLDHPDEWGAGNPVQRAAAGRPQRIKRTRPSPRGLPGPGDGRPSILSSGYASDLLRVSPDAAAAQRGRR